MFVSRSFFQLLFALTIGLSMPQSPIQFEKPVFDGTRFANPDSFTNWTGIPSFSDILRWKFVEKDDSKLPPDEVLDETLPVTKPSFTELSRLSLTWLGHATTLVRLDGVTFITDPVWTKTASPVFKGPRRYRPPPCEIAELPRLDFALISHNHYDHLDSQAVRAISERFRDMKWFIPLGLRSEFLRWGVPESCVFELNWGESKIIEFNGKTFEIWCVPAQHWSQRYLFDRFKTLWSGWVVVGPTRRFYFAGDTGFCGEEFVKIGAKLGPFDLSAIPIGCYAPRWFMKPQHISPEEAVQIHMKVRSKKSIGIHWGTYAMGSSEAYLEPPEFLRKEVKKAQLSPSSFTVLGHGETWIESEDARSEDASDQEHPDCP